MFDARTNDCPPKITTLLKLQRLCSGWIISVPTALRLSSAPRGPSSHRSPICRGWICSHSSSPLIQRPQGPKGHPACTKATPGQVHLQPPPNASLLSWGIGVCWNGHRWRETEADRGLGWLMHISTLYASSSFSFHQDPIREWQSLITEFLVAVSIGLYFLPNNFQLLHLLPQLWSRNSSPRI